MSDLNAQTSASTADVPPPKADAIELHVAGITVPDSTEQEL